MCKEENERTGLGQEKVVATAYPPGRVGYTDYPEIRTAIRRYTLIAVAAQIVLDERSRQAGGHNRSTVLMVRDTRELLMDGRPAIDVVYSTSTAMPLRDGIASFTEHTQVPIETIHAIVERLENGDIPYDGLRENAIDYHVGTTR